MDNSTLQYFEDVVDWRHRRAGRAHTLVRAMRSTVTGRVVAVVSELASNPDDRGITDDFGSVADAVLPALRRAFGAEPVEVFWIAHFGAFSYHDPTGPESFTLITLTADAGDDRYTMTAKAGGEDLTVGGDFEGHDDEDSSDEGDS